VAERSRPSSRAAGLGQHSLRNELIAADLVVAAGISRDDVVWEIGAGSGRLTHALAHRARQVFAVELDPRSAHRLRRAFAGVDNVEIVTGDALLVPLPERPFRAFGNVPFGATTAILRRLLDDPSPWLRAIDVVVQLGVAHKRASGKRATLLSTSWAPWWSASVGRRLEPSDFLPPPSVSAAVLFYRRRHPELLPPSERPAYLAMLRSAFGDGGSPIGRSLRAAAPSRTLAEAGRRAGVDLGSRPGNVGAAGWIALFTELRRTTDPTPRR
jgi:23S rRNA (adenine-N6)-dimethyltransferase